MASHDTDRLDFNKLQKELDAAVEKDAKYWRENDAKIRAVSEQKVASYDEFKDLVAASHLKPLNKGDRLDNINEFSKHPWNPAASGAKQNSDVSKTSQTRQGEVKVPKNSQEFAKEWQRNIKTPQQRYTYLLNCGSAHLAQIFRTEVSFGLLGDILAALVIFEKENIKTVVDILLSLKQSNRFVLSLQFLSKKEKDVCAQLFDKLSEVIEEDGNAAELRETVSGLRADYLTS
ncbi:coiled-coil domain-containing protein 103-like [Littorina saxatilis]|uniref:Coiled-coil domain-containing protein 103 n=1 Tax=Littorina saxatilis TaxID=31220 RepID=A0AAN9GM36_9CAEN